MSTTTRNFNGSRPPGNMGSASRWKKLELMKGGKLPLTSAERYKMVLNEKLASQQSELRKHSGAFVLPGAKPAETTTSRTKEQALKEVARRKAIKEEKALRQMVVIKPKRFYDNQGYFGRIDRKGNVYDETDQIVLKVDGRNKGMVKTMGGMTLGKYNPKKFSHIGWMRTWLTKYSPYMARMRQLELQRQVAAMYGNHAGMVTVHGAPDLSAHTGDAHGNTHELTGQRNNLGVNAWGVMSNNVHGTFGDNVWGTFSDNVWGTASSNIWGGIGAPSGWGARPGRNIWGSGRPDQKNYIAMGMNWLINWTSSRLRIATGRIGPRPGR